MSYLPYPRWQASKSWLQLYAYSNPTALWVRNETHTHADVLGFQDLHYTLKPQTSAIKEPLIWRQTPHLKHLLRWQLMHSYLDRRARCRELHSTMWNHYISRFLRGIPVRHRPGFLLPSRSGLLPRGALTSRGLDSILVTAACMTHLYHF